MLNRETWSEFGRPYKKETSYLLNHLTLNIREQSIANERLRYKNIQMGKISLPCFLMVTLSACVTILNYYVAQKGHFVLLITSACNFLILGSLFFLYWCKLYKVSVVFFNLYYVVHALSVILVYSDWLPGTLSQNKFELRYQNVINYVLVMCVPIHSYARTFFIMTPIFLLTTYVQLSYEASLNT
jgi:hypothetical protein